jgi:hypothetical protein
MLVRDGDKEEGWEMRGKRGRVVALHIGMVYLA